MAATINLPDVLVSSLFVLSFIPAPFTLELVAPLLALAQTKTEKHATLRRLVNLGFLSYNASLQQYSMHKVVREAARLLVHNLGEWQPRLKATSQPQKSTQQTQAGSVLCHATTICRDWRNNLSLVLYRVALVCRPAIL